MPQFARPSVDTYNSDGYTTQAGSGSNLFAGIDETVADDSDYIRSAQTPTSDVYVTKLTSVVDPVSSTGHFVRFRYSTDVPSGGETLTLLVQIRQGYTNEGSQGTLIAAHSLITGITGTGWVDDSITLSGPECDAITDYTNLYLRFVFDKP